MERDGTHRQSVTDEAKRVLRAIQATFDQTLMIFEIYIMQER